MGKKWLKFLEHIMRMEDLETLTKATMKVKKAKSNLLDYQVCLNG